MKVEAASQSGPERYFTHNSEAINYNIDLRSKEKGRLHIEQVPGEEEDEDAHELDGAEDELLGVVWLFAVHPPGDTGERAGGDEGDEGGEEQLACMIAGL